MDISPAGAVTLASGTNTTLTATALTRDDRPLASAGITWVSSNEAVASATGGLVTAKRVGTARITAVAGGVSSPGVDVTVSPGQAALLVIRTQPGGAASGAPMTLQPAVEVHDAAGNLVTSSALDVTAALAPGGGTLTGTVTATAANGVATFTNLGVSGLVGQHTLSFTANAVSPATSAAFTLTAGQPTSLAIRTQPVAGTAYVPLTTQPVVEVRDGAGNLANSNATVTAAIASGGGTLRGTAAVAAAGGVATFTTLTIDGDGGPRTLQFTSGTLTRVTSASFDVATAPPAVITVPASIPTMTTVVGSSPAPLDIPVGNAGVVPLTNLRVESITYEPAVSSWLATSFPSGTTAPATLRLTAASASLGVGAYTATVVLAGDGATATRSFVLTLTVFPRYIDTYGTSANKVSLLEIGSAVSPGLVTTTPTGDPAPSDPTATYASRIPSVATVDATGRITAIAPGQAWVVASSALYNADSVLVIVPRASGVVLRSNLTTYRFAVGDTITVHVLVDTRGTSLGAATVTFTWPVWGGSPATYNSLSLIDINTSLSPLAPVTTFDPQLNVIRITGASVAGASGLVELATIRLRANVSGINVLYLNAIELLAADLSNLLPAATVTQYPIMVP